MLRQEQIDAFHRNGFLIMRGLVRGHELRALRAAVDAVQAEGLAGKGAEHRYYENRDGTKTYWRSESMWDRDAIFGAVTVQPDLLENIGQCTGHAFFPWNASLVVKLARSGAPVPYHQDPPYGTAFGDENRQRTFSIPNFTTDIYLDHSGPDNGCVYAIPGHHLVGHVGLTAKTEEQLFNECGAVPLEMEAGDVLFHCLSVPHGSKPNRSDRQRRIFYVHYLAEEVYRDGYGDRGWAKDKPGWCPRRRASIERMIAQRASFGWEVPAQRRTLRFGEQGFEFVGRPTTPPRHWDALAAAIPGERCEEMRALRSASLERQEAR